MHRTIISLLLLVCVSAVAQDEEISHQFIPTIIKGPPVYTASIPEELRYIIPPQVDDNATWGWRLRMDSVTNSSPDATFATYWDPKYWIVQVSTNGLPDYIGETSTNGVLRTDDTIDYSNGVDWVTLSANSSNIWVTIVDNDYYGTSNYPRDEMVAVHSGEDPGYIGTTATTGVLWTTDGITKDDAGNHVVLGLDYDIVISNINEGGEAGWTSNHTDLSFSSMTDGIAGQNSDHDARYWAHGKAYNDANGGLWGKSIGRGAGATSADAQVISLTNMNLSDGSTVYLDWNDGWTKDASGNFSFNWKNRTLTDTGATNVVNWETRTYLAESITVGTAAANKITLLPSSIAAQLSGAASIYSGGGVDIFAEGSGTATFGATGTGLASFGSTGGDASLYSGKAGGQAYIGAVNVGLNPTTALKVNGNVGQTIMDGAVKLSEHGILVNDGSWTVQTITYLTTDGATNTMTVLAKP